MTPLVMGMGAPKVEHGEDKNPGAWIKDNRCHVPMLEALRLAFFHS